MYSPLVRHQRILLVVGVLGLVLFATPFTVASTAAKSGGGPMPPVAPNLSTFPSELRFVHPPALGAGGHASAPHPSYGYVYYTQEGATLAQFNGTSSQSGVKSISEDIPLVNSPYPIGYELNGLTSTGDWYQIVIGVNWPGCSGYEMITEVWNNAQYGGPVGCSTAVTMTPGDLIRLGLNFSAKAGICMDLTDVTRSSGAILCQAQPDAGASEFITLQSTSNTNGYFTGPMTEIANTSAGSCPDYTHMPLVNYEYPKSFGLDEYVAWSDEFELTTGSPCYGSSGGLIGFSSGDPATDYDDTAIGTSYGPHYVAGQLYSLVTPSYGFRIQTDPVPLTSLTLSASATTIPVSTNVTLTASLGGGVKPYTAIWSLNGTIFANGSLQRNFTGAVPGSYKFNAYGVDKLLDVIGPSSTVTVLVNGPLAVSSITTSLATGNADVGQSITFRVAASGGLPPYSYAWFGLPAECPGSNVPTVACTPTSPGTYPIHVTVTDANHTVLDSGTRAFVVSPALAPTLQASVTQLDIGQSTALVLTVIGGSGNLTYGWAGLPPPCAAANRASIDCAPSAQGLYTVTATVSDTNGLLATTSGLAVQVYPTPSVSLTVNRAIADAGVAMTFTAGPSGGSGGFSVAWSGLPPGCVGGDLVLLICAPSAGGTFPVSVNATDSAGETAGSPTVIVFAYSALNLSVLGPTSVLVGSTLNATVSVSGGAPGVSYQWSGLPDGCSPPGSAQLTCQPTAAGTYNITVTAVDGGGGVSTITYEVSVVYPTATTGTSVAGLPTLYLVGVLMAAVIVVVAVVASRRRPPQ